MNQIYTQKIKYILEQGVFLKMTKKTINNLLYGIPIAVASFFPINKANGQMIPKDKQFHLEAGAVIGAWGTLLAKPEERHGWKPVITGISSATIAGIGKETYDAMCGRKFDLKDLGATIIGGAVSVGIIKLCTPKKKSRFMHYGSTIIENNPYKYSCLSIKENEVYK